MPADPISAPPSYQLWNQDLPTIEKLQKPLNYAIKLPGNTSYCAQLPQTKEPKSKQCFQQTEVPDVYRRPE